ncbi:MAG: hypothetical protein H0W58_00470 [Acidobacteria bacterium]|jgi:hypothetical protein|nr:hypothetical protein [Acidobacteriota bacterium]
MSRNFFNLCTVLLILFIITACVCRSDRNSGRSVNTKLIASNTDSEEQTQVNVNSESINAKDKKADRGDFIVQHDEVKNPRYKEIDHQIKEEKELEKAAQRLNQSLILPHDIYMRTKDCGEANAFYDDQDYSVTVCYELMEHFYKLFKSNGDSDQKAYENMFDAVRFAFLHEIGHALIDTYNLPLTGNEEDAADRCSTYINLEELGDDGVRAVIAASDAFKIESRKNLPNKRNLADEHLLQEQRSYNSLCLTYGSNPTKFAYIVNDGYLPQERAARCPSEYERTAQSWSKLLAPWRKS